MDRSLGGYAPKQAPRPAIMIGRRWVPKGSAGWWEARVLLVQMGAREDSWLQDVKWVPMSHLEIAEPPPTPKA